MEQIQAFGNIMLEDEDEVSEVTGICNFCSGTDLTTAGTLNAISE